MAGKKREPYIKITVTRPVGPKGHQVQVEITRFQCNIMQSDGSKCTTFKANLKEIKYHQLISHAPKKCSEGCDEYFQDALAEEYHRWLEHQEERTCPRCKCSMQMHNIIAHSIKCKDPEGPLECSVCQETLFNTDALRYHMGKEHADCVDKKDVSKAVYACISNREQKKNPEKPLISGNCGTETGVLSAASKNNVPFSIKHKAISVVKKNVLKSSTENDDKVCEDDDDMILRSPLATTTRASNRQNNQEKGMAILSLAQGAAKRKKDVVIAVSHSTAPLKKQKVENKTTSGHRQSVKAREIRKHKPTSSRVGRGDLTDSKPVKSSNSKLYLSKINQLGRRPRNFRPLKAVESEIGDPISQPSALIKKKLIKHDQIRLLFDLSKRRNVWVRQSLKPQQVLDDTEDDETEDDDTDDTDDDDDDDDEEDYSKKTRSNPKLDPYLPTEAHLVAKYPEGLEKGHMADLANNPDTPNLLSVTAPQYRLFNRGAWKRTETMTTRIRFRNHHTEVIAGAIYNNTKFVKTTDGKLFIPIKFYKIISGMNDLNEITEQEIWLIKHRKKKIKSLRKYKASLEEVENASGLTFPTHVRHVETE